MRCQLINASTAGLANWLRPGAIAFIRALPRVRGRGRLAKVVNEGLLKAGADPAAIALMSEGHSLAVDCRLFGQSMMLFSGTYGLEDFIAVLLAFLKPGGVVLDIGANVGTVTVPLALAAKRVGSRVIAFEPYPRHVEWNRKNLILNHVEDQVTIVECGLSSEPGEATLLLHNPETGAGIGNASVAEPGLDEGCQSVTIRLNTLDELWPTFGSPRLDAIKIDIEGHEDRFLEGARDTLAANRPVFLMEVNRMYYDRRGISFDQVIPDLLPPDYRYFTSGRKEIRHLAHCRESDVLLVPAEKAELLRAS